MYLISPTENDLYKIAFDRCTISPIPEAHGADILFKSAHGLCGLQRKAIPHDFLRSVSDGRLTREIALLKTLPIRALIAEGWPFRYFPDTTVVADGVPKGTYRFTKKGIDGLVFSLMFVHEIPIIPTKDMNDTAIVIDNLIEYLSDPRAHLSLFRRPGCPSEWGIPSAGEFGLWILQSFSGVGPVLAQNIINAFGGNIPLKWDCTLDDLRNVKGIGEARAKSLWERLPASRYKV